MFDKLSNMLWKHECLNRFLDSSPQFCTTQPTNASIQVQSFSGGQHRMKAIQLRAVTNHFSGLKVRNYIPWYCLSLVFQWISFLLSKSLWPSDTTWQHRIGPILAQEMACCLSVPSHYPNQLWFMIRKVHLHSLWAISLSERSSYIDLWASSS